MSTDYSSKKFKKLLDKLQQDSWQLELLISGFVIFGLFSALEEIREPIFQTQIKGELFKGIFLSIIASSCSVLILNLITHLILRGLWIGALGLRYVSGDIDFEVLNYSDKFKKFLQKKIVSFDKYIATLENYCSILFAISFLLIFYLLSFFVLFIIVGAIAILLLKNDTLPEVPRKVLGFTLLVILAVGTIITMIDFFTQGFLKKKRKFSKIYFPIYRVFSYITLSFLYRPIVYNFLDNKFGKRISIFLVPIYIFIALLTSFQYKTSNYVDDTLKNNPIAMHSTYYEDMLLEDYELVRSTSIQSKVITQNYLKVFHVLRDKTDDYIFKYAPDLKPEKDSRGYFTTAITFDDHTKTEKQKDSLSKKYIEIFNKSHQILIDSVSYSHDFLITKNKKGQLGFETYINIKNLTEGKHIFLLKRLEKDEKEIEESIIPFWHYKP